MRLLFLVLTFLLGCTPAMAGADIPSSTKDMLHLTVTATNVRLRAGAGTEFEVLGMASRDNECARLYVADSTPRMDSTGKPWFKLIANVQIQEETAIIKLDTPCWIRSDFVKTRALRGGEAMKADSVFYRIVHVALDSYSVTAKFVPSKDIPVCATEEDCLWAEGHPIINSKLPAGEEFYFFSIPSKVSEGEMCINVYKQIEPERAKIVGCMPKDVFNTFDFGKDTEAVQAWKKKQNAWYWE